MMNEEKIDQLLQQALSPVIPDEKLNQRLKREMEGKKMKKFMIKKVILIAAACCLMLGTVSIASSGIVSYVTSHSKAYGEKDFTKLAELEKEAGFSIKALETFTNGYAFSQMMITDNTDHDENGNALSHYKGISLNYEKSGEDKLFIDVEQEANVHSANEREPDQTMMIGDIEVKYYLDTYKWVPADYELTEADKINMEKDNYNISYGTDKVSENFVSSVNWVQNGIWYSIMNIYDKTEPEVLLEMAQELIMAE